MKSKILSRLDTTKKKVGAIVFGGALVAAISTGTAFAANTINSLQIKMENGIASYSTDDGNTWSTNVPEGVTVSEDGKVTVTNGIPPKDGEQGLLSKVEDGIRTYSTDGGNTWSTNVPAGAEDSEQTIGND